MSATVINVDSIGCLHLRVANNAANTLSTNSAETEGSWFEDVVNFCSLRVVEANTANFEYVVRECVLVIRNYEYYVLYYYLK
jgi:hypothetical protein